MHESDSFIAEVSEEVRRERLANTLRRYGGLIAVAVVLIVGGAAFHSWNEARTRAAAASAGDAMAAALAEPDHAKRAEALSRFAADTPDAKVLGVVAQAGSLETAGDRDGAASLLAGIAEDGSAEPLWRSLAALERVMLLGPDMDASERQATLEGLAAPNAPFRSLALEQRALMHLEAGDRSAAITDLNAALADPTATQALQSRARQLIVAAGGSIEPPAATAAQPVDG